MAKKKTTSTDSYEKYKEYHKDSTFSKSDFKQIEKVRDRFIEARTARQNNCYWRSSADASSETTGGDWEYHWSLCEKMRLQWASESSSDNYQSNVKSPMATGRINAFVNQFKKLNLAWDAKPNNDDDRNIAKVAAKALDWWYQNSNAKSEFVKVADSAATYGTGFFRVFYLEETRKYRFPKIKPEDMTEKEREKLKEGKTIWGEPEDVTISDDIAIEYIPIREMYPDPNAWCIHGVNRRARYMIRRRFVHIDDFKAMFKGNPNAMNIDKVKPASTYTKMDTYDFFKTPEDVVDKNSVELIEYENQIDDEYIVLANDILVINCPLIYNHKQISYHKVDFIKNPNQFYGIGIPDLLMNIQGAQEILINMMYDYIYRTYNQRWFIDGGSFGELSEDMLRVDTQLIPVDLSDGKAIGSKVQQMVVQPIGFDAFQLNDLTERSATIATNIDPSQLALMPQNKTATATIQNREQLNTMIFGVIDNFVNEGWFYGGRQVWKLMQQFWSIPKVRSVVGDDKKKKEYKKIRLEGIELELNEDTKDLDVKESKKEYSFFEMTEEYLKTSDEIDIMIKPDSIEIMSKSLEMQKMKEEFAQLIQFAVDPNNSQAMQMHPMPMVNAAKLFQRYFEVEGLPQDLLIQPEYREDIEEKKAEDHIMRILRGERVPGTPGATPAHRKFEAKALFALDAQIQSLEAEAEEIIKKQMQELSGQPRFDPMTGEPLPMPEPQIDPQLEQKIIKFNEIRQRLAEHLAMENMPADVIEETAIEGRQPQQQMGAPVPTGTDMSTPMPGMPGEMDVPMPQPQQMQMTV